mmetsp:Transcript_5677/g.12381  ORF Transcript_5677/g.12381 Transcript_5677/m.12381 type:complete len:313 (+) Transcript_5677:591-1529(+)
MVPPPLRRHPPRPRRPLDGGALRLGPLGRGPRRGGRFRRRGGVEGLRRPGGFSNRAERKKRVDGRRGVVFRRGVRGRVVAGDSHRGVGSDGFEFRRGGRREREGRRRCDDDDDDDDRVSKRDVDRGSDRSSRTVRSRRRRGALAGRGAGQIVREESERPSIRRLERGRRGAARSRDDGRHIGGRGEGGQRRRFQNRRSGIRLRRRRRRSRLRRRGRRRNRRDVSRCRRSSPSDPRGHGIRNHRRGGRGAVEPPPRGKLVVRSQSRVRGEGVVGVVEGGHDVRVRRRGPGQLQRGQRRAVVLRRGGQSRVSGR